jgi:hypothetical protein
MQIQQIQEPITESAEGKNKCTKNRKQKDMPMHNQIFKIITMIMMKLIIVLIYIETAATTTAALLHYCYTTTTATLLQY